MVEQDFDWYEQLSGTYEGRVQSAVDNLNADAENGEVDPRDCERIHDLLEYEALVEGKANSTLKTRTFALHKTAERSQTALVEHDIESLTKLLNDFKSGRHPDVKEGGISVSNYQKALRLFYRRHDDLGITPEDIEIDQDPGKDLQPEDLLYRDEVDAILQQTRDLRDRAMFALLLATGQRRDAVRTLRIKHVEADQRTMTVRLNDTEGALKDASGTVPLLWAKHYVREWYRNHPFRDDPEAALFPPAKGAVPEDDRRSLMHEESINKAIRRMAERADVEKSEYGVTPHILRATAITRMAAKGVSEQRIKQIAGWSRDSSQFNTYVALADDINNDRAREELGYATSKGDPPTIGRPTLETCPNTGCGDPIPEGRDTCPTCGFDLSAPADEPEPVPDSASTPPIEGEDPIDRMLSDASEAGLTAEQVANTLADAVFARAARRDDIDLGDLEPGNKPDLFKETE